MIIHKLTERFQPARLGFTHLKHTEVPRVTCLFCLPFRQGTLQGLLKTLWLAIKDRQCTCRNAHAGWGYTWQMDFFSVESQKVEWCKWTFFHGQVNGNTILPKFMHMPRRLRWRAVGVKPALHLAAGIGPSLHKLKVREEKVKGDGLLLRGSVLKCGPREQAVLAYFPQLVSHKKPTHSRQQDWKSQFSSLLVMRPTLTYLWPGLTLSHDLAHWECMSSVDLSVCYLSSYFCSWEYLSPMS